MNQLIELAQRFYSRVKTEPDAERLIRRVGREFLGDCVYDFEVEDHPGLQLIYRDGDLTVEEGRFAGDPGAFSEVLHIEIRRPDLEDMLEGRLAVAEAHRERKYFMSVQPELNIEKRVYVCFWGALTRIGQDVVRSEKAAVDWMDLPAS